MVIKFPIEKFIGFTRKKGEKSLVISVPSIYFAHIIFAAALNLTVKKTDSFLIQEPLLYKDRM